MYFKKLELVGFKSFFDKTTLHFEPGITAVVGPNGCGKSNLFDGIRWVLGEQSAKALRGSAMEDVIFNGTDSKEPLGMAEVTLAFDNTNRFFPVEHEDVVITRRIFRSGESEYLLNKTVVRLKDILDILSGTGIGAEGYSLVEQGKIDLILSARPEDRRLVFDEAAGIVKYKIQKKEALRKLEETEQNLTRVNDIITEVKRQIGSLERQANKARRYKEVFEDLKSKEINLAISQKNSSQGQKDQITGQLRELQDKETRFLNIIQEEESKISDCQAELKGLEDNLTSIRENITSIDNSVLRNRERIKVNQERITELDSSKKYLHTQIEQMQKRLVADEERLNKAKQDCSSIKENITEKNVLLKEKEGELNNINSCVKISLDNIAKSKRGIMDLVTKLTNVKNDVTDLMAKEQACLARKKRLEIEGAKVAEEKTVAQDSLSSITQELKGLEKNFQDLSLAISQLKQELEQERSSLAKINKELEDLEKQKLTLLSQKEFVEKLKTKYDDIGESMDVVIHLDKPPSEKISALVIKVKGYLDSLKLSGEAKPIDLDSRKINSRIEQIEAQINSLKNSKTAGENRISQLNKSVEAMQEERRNQEMALVNKKAFHQTILEQFNKIKEEEDIVVLELSDVDKELSVLQEKLAQVQSQLSVLEKEQKDSEDLISSEQNNITLNSNLKEKVLVVTTQAKTELETLNKRTVSDEAAVGALQERYDQDREGILNLENQEKQASEKQVSLESEIKDLESEIKQRQDDLQNQKECLNETEAKHKENSQQLSQITKKIDTDRKELDVFKNNAYQLQMQAKEVDFKILSITERILQAYKTDLDTVSEVAQEFSESQLTNEIQRLKEKLDSYGSVNLVAIEEYDELKKRYDFLVQQQNDLLSAKDSLHEAILKINRTTRKLFLETFEKIREEFRNYFKLLFNGGDAQVFLIDEQEPLESGIEIICRPPGKKLQNVLLLSGGEKALSAIALLFAIFKIKPSPFCVLDEIDAALDEANVDRFSRLLQDFSKTSQFIVITHNKKTIVNANVMYGITMAESGVSKIVSVKFVDKEKPKEEREAVAEPV
jgi:chromosome segregation protein